LGECLREQRGRRIDTLGSEKREVKRWAALARPYGGKGKGANAIAGGEAAKKKNVKQEDSHHPTGKNPKKNKKKKKHNTTGRVKKTTCPRGTSGPHIETLRPERLESK